MRHFVLNVSYAVAVFLVGVGLGVLVYLVDRSDAWILYGLTMAGVVLAVVLAYVDGVDEGQRMARHRRLS